MRVRIEIRGFFGEFINKILFRFFGEFINKILFIFVQSLSELYCIVCNVFTPTRKTVDF